MPYAQSSRSRLIDGLVAAYPGPSSDRYARYQLDEHIQAICRTLHGTQPGTPCAKCAELRRSA